MATSDLSALYKNKPVHVWVEDELTRAYLQAAWGPQGSIGLLIAGSSANVRVAVAQARKDGFTQVFGIRDRDFEPGGASTWKPSTTVFRLNVHEAENFLLDAKALAASPLNGAGRTDSEIEAKLKAEATNLTWGMALGATSRWLNDELHRDFPTPGSLASVPDEATANHRLFTADWQAASSTLPQRIDRPAVEAHLRQAHQRFTQDLSSGDWRSTFAGKELLGRLIGYLAPKAGAAPHDISLAKSVGTYHLLNGQPSDVQTALHELLAIANPSAVVAAALTT